MWPQLYSAVESLYKLLSLSNSPVWVWHCHKSPHRERREIEAENVFCSAAAHCPCLVSEAGPGLASNLDLPASSVWSGGRGQSRDSLALAIQKLLYWYRWQVTSEKASFQVISTLNIPLCVKYIICLPNLFFHLLFMNFFKSIQKKKTYWYSVM